MVYCESCGAANESVTEICFVCQRPFADTEELETVLVQPSANLENENRNEEPDTLLHGRYKLLQEVGTGGFGAVYKAIDTQTYNRIVAIKEIRLQGLKPNEIIDATDTFNREVNILSDLRHPNLPRVYDHFTGPERWYLVMDFIDGQTLETYLENRGGRLPLDECFTLAIQICTVLHYLHTREPVIIFRDLKPTNIMITSNKQVYLIDFGAARYFKAGRTKDTIAFGSPGYAAPEQYGKAQTTARSDIYSLGATLHEALSGKDPAESPFHFGPIRVPGQTIPPDLEALILRMVDMDMNRRPISAASVKVDLWRISTQHTHRLYIQPTPQPSIPPYRSTFGVGQPPPASWATSAPSVQQAQMQLGFAPTPAPRKRGFSRRAAVATIIMGIAGVTFLENSRALWGRSYSTQGPGPYMGSGPGTGPMITRVDVLKQGTFTFHTNTVTSLDWSPQGSYIASGSLDKTLRIWSSDIDGTETIQTLGDGVRTVGWSPDALFVAAASGGRNGELQIWNSSAKAGDQPVRTFNSPSSGAINTLAWAPSSQIDGTYIAIGSSDGIISVINGINNSISNAMTMGNANKSPIMSMAWAPDGGSLAVGSADATVHVWPISLNKSSPSISEFIFAKHSDRITALAWTADQTNIVSGSADKTVMVWDTSGNIIQSYRLTSPVTTLALSSQNTLAIGTEDGTVNLYPNFETDSIHTITNDGMPIRSISWAPDGSSLVIGGDNKQAIIYNIIVENTWPGNGPHHWGQ